MEPNTTYRPPFHLGDSFVNYERKIFEIIETHWGIPGKPKDPVVTIELATGHKIHFTASPERSVLQKVGVRLEDHPDAKIVVKTVTELKQAVENKKIKFL